MGRTIAIMLAMVLALGAGGGMSAGIEDAGRPAQQWTAVFDGAAQKDDKYLNALEARAGGYVAVGMSERAERSAFGQAAYDGVIAGYGADGSERWKTEVPFTKLESVIETDRGYLAAGVTVSREAPFEARAAVPSDGDSGDAAAILFDKRGASCGRRRWAAPGTTPFLSATGAASTIRRRWKTVASSPPARTTATRCWTKARKTSAAGWAL